VLRYKQVSPCLFLPALFRDWVLPVGIPPTRNPQNASLEIHSYAVLFDTIHDNIQSASSGECPDYGRLVYVAVLIRRKVLSFQRIV